MNIKQVSLVVMGICWLNMNNVAESALPFGVFPILTSGWYYKPSPVESVIFGLIVVKILAIRLASVTGVLPIPYHLNDLFLRSLGKRSIPENFSLNLANLTMPHKTGTASLGSTELQAAYRLLLGVRRMDTKDCFLKTLCFLGYETTNATGISYRDHQILETLDYLTSVEETLRKTQDQLIMDVFHKALLHGRESKTASSCDSEYRTCPLSETDMNYESILFDLS